jgi:hypothetical protein
MDLTGVRGRSWHAGCPLTRQSPRSAWRLAPALLAAVALAAPSQATAQPAPHWYADGTLVAGFVHFTSAHEHGGLLIHLPPGTINCSMHVTSGSVINPSGGEAGISEMSVLKAKQGKNKSIASCEIVRPGGPEGCEESYRVFARTLPVRTHLAIEPSLTGVRDVIEGTPLDIYCETSPERFSQVASITGALKPRVGNSRLEFEGEPVSVELFKENEEVWGTEAGPNEVVTATLTGGFRLKGKGHHKKILTAQ